MADTLLTIVQTACDELGLQRPSAVVNATDLQIRQLYSLVNRDLRELQQNFEWTALQAEYDLTVRPPITLFGDLQKGSILVQNVVGTTPSDFNSDFGADFFLTNPALVVPLYWLMFAQGLPINNRVVAANPALGTLTLSEPPTQTIAQAPLTCAQDTYPGPTDFDRYINETWWDRTNRWALLGPDSPQMDQWHRSGVVTTGPRRRFRQIGSGANTYRLWPPPGAADSPFTIAFEYISANPVVSAAGTPQTRFLADTDTCVLDTQILVLGVKWRMWQIKGFDFADMQQEYQDYVDRRYAYDGGAKTLSVVGATGGSGLLGSGNVPSGSFPGPSGPNMS